MKGKVVTKEMKREAVTVKARVTRSRSRFQTMSETVRTRVLIHQDFTATIGREFIQGVW